MLAGDQGVNRQRYMLVPRTLVFISHGDEVLLLKGDQDKRLWAGLYNGVGGHVERGESVLSAAQRELLEETGLQVDDLWLCGTIAIDTAQNPGVCVFVFKGETLQPMRLASHEGLLEWVKASDITQLPLVNDLPVLLPKILQMVKGDEAFSAHSFYDKAGKLVVTFS